MALARPGVNRIYETLYCPHCNTELFKTEKTQKKLGVYVSENWVETRYSGAQLPPTEMQILRLLLILYPNTMRRDSYYELTPSTTLTIHIHKLRKKIAPLGLYIHNHHGIGYSLEIAEPKSGT